MLEVKSNDDPDWGSPNDRITTAQIQVFTLLEFILKMLTYILRGIWEKYINQYLYKHIIKTHIFNLLVSAAIPIMCSLCMYTSSCRHGLIHSRNNLPISQPIRKNIYQTRTETPTDDKFPTISLSLTCRLSSLFPQN